MQKKAKLVQMTSTLKRRKCSPYLNMLSNIDQWYMCVALKKPFKDARRFLAFLDNFKFYHSESSSFPLISELFMLFSFTSFFFIFKVLSNYIQYLFMLVLIIIFLM